MMMNNKAIALEIVLSLLLTVLFTAVESSYGQQQQYQFSPSTGLDTPLEFVPANEEIGIARDAMEVTDPQFMQIYKQCHDFLDFNNSTMDYDQCTAIMGQTEEKYCGAQTHVETVCGYTIILGGWLENKFFESPLPLTTITTTPQFYFVQQQQQNTSAPLTPYERHQQLKELHAQQQQQQQPTTTTTTAPAAPPATPTLPTTTTDPELQRFDQIVNDCTATVRSMYPTAQIGQDVFMTAPQPGTATAANFQKMMQCNQLLNQAVAQYCNVLATYDAAKCAYVNTPQTSSLIDLTAIIAEQDFLYGPGGLGSSSLNPTTTTITTPMLTYVQLQELTQVLPVNATSLAV
jgi:hypothetical protein